MNYGEPWKKTFVNCEFDLSPPQAEGCSSDLSQTTHDLAGTPQEQGQH